ncbi:Uncharacterized protein PPKH_1988 [Pseudomonas putida]|nr:Uncharacterized protein PPKH_1988 [Pseudomonas putida]
MFIPWHPVQEPLPLNNDIINGRGIGGRFLRLRSSIPF